MKTKNIRQQITFKAKTKDVYEALVDSRKHSKFTNSKAKVSRKVGAKFTVFKGALYGRNLEIKPNKKIVQEWCCKMKAWPKDHYSRVTFSFSRIKGGTKLILYHSGVPSACHKDIIKGWKNYYWNPMNSMLEK